MYSLNNLEDPYTLNREKPVQAASAKYSMLLIHIHGAPLQITDSGKPVS
jgi:hypothetical protein